MSENRYMTGVADDQLKEYRKIKREEKLNLTMVDFSSRAADLVAKRNELISHGYTMPGESVASMSNKMNGIFSRGGRKNLYKMFLRIVVRRKAANVKWWKDKWHGRKKRPPSKEEQEMVIKESEAMFDAADQGNKKLVKVALRYFAIVDHRRNGRTSFQTIFIRLCWIDAGLEIEPTWQEGYKVNDRADYEGCMRKLLDNGADINAVEGKNTDGWVVVHHAAYLGCYKRVKYFLENGGTVDVKNNVGETALMKACEGGHLDVIMLLVYTKHAITAKSDKNLTLLHFAALAGNLNVLKFLLEAGIDKLAVDDEENTALDICNSRRYRVCSEVLSKFKMDKPPMKGLVEYWKEIQEAERPESPSLFGHLGGGVGNSRGGERKSRNSSWRDMRNSRGDGGGEEEGEEKEVVGRGRNITHRGGGIAKSLSQMALKSPMARKTRKTLMDPMKGATFGKQGGKAQQKAERNKREMEKKAEKDRLEQGEPEKVSALGYLEGLLAEVPLPVMKPRKKVEVVKEEVEEVGKLGGLEPEGKQEFETALALAEAGGEGEVVLDDVPKKGRKASILELFSPVKGKAAGKVRESVKSELFEKLSMLSPWKKKGKKKGEEVGGVGGEGGGGALPVILSPQQQMEARVQEGEELNVKKEKKKRNKKKKKQKVEDGDIPKLELGSLELGSL